MCNPTIEVFGPDVKEPLGGVKMLYRHVDILNSYEFEARIVHQQEAFKVGWFEHDTPVVYRPEMRKDLDVGVFPEIWGPRINVSGKDIRKVVFCQNAYYTY